MPTLYRGRFAPSPTGPLHFGSLVAALASFLEARIRQGFWHLRIEDLDPLREPPEARDQILRALEAHELFWDGPVYTQSLRHSHYIASIDQLAEQGLVYPCRCSRRQLQQARGVHAARCRAKPLEPGTTWWHPGQRETTAPQPAALRFRLSTQTYHWDDEQLGPCTRSVLAETDDFVLLRKEGFFAYQLAVVNDDIAQGITHVVRGSDLLECTPLQMALYAALGATPPRFLHLPLATNAQGQKLSKQSHAPALALDTAGANLWHALSFLGQLPPEALSDAAPREVLQWARENWRRESIPRSSRPSPG